MFINNDTFDLVLITEFMKHAGAIVLWCADHKQTAFMESGAIMKLKSRVLGTLVHVFIMNVIMYRSL